MTLELVSADALVGKAVVLRGLSLDQRKAMSAATRMPPRIGMVVRVLSGGRLYVKLSMGSLGCRRWFPRGRICLLTNVVREATRREVLVGMPIGPIEPAVAA